MDERLEKIKKQSKKNNFKEDGKPRASRARLQHRGASEYLEQQGDVYTPAEAEQLGIEDAEGRIRVGDGFKINKLKEKQETEKALKEYEKTENRGEILTPSGEETELGKEIAEKLVEMKDEKIKFEIHKEARDNAVNSLWNISQENHEVIENSIRAFSSEFGLYASIPMLCKGESCVYAELYPELHGDLTQPGERCPVEVAIILSKYEQYKKDLEIDPEDAVDMSILRDVIDYDVQIVRAENKVAVEGDFVKDVVVGISQTGQEIVQEQITQASEYKQRIQNARNKALNLLNSTRKDKAGEKVTFTMDPSSYSKELLAKANQEIIEGDFEEVEEVDFFDNLDIIEDVDFIRKQKGELDDE